MIVEECGGDERHVMGGDGWMDVMKGTIRGDNT